MPMPTSSYEQKRIEWWYLAAARNVGVPYLPENSPARNLILDLPTSGALGIELTEILRPASSNHGISPVEEESFHREIIEAAQRDYYTTPNANPVHVNVYFTNARGKRQSKHELARTLSKFVQANAHRANPVAPFGYKDTPNGFDWVVIVAQSNPRDWCSGEVGSVTVADIRNQVEARIAAKNSLVDTIVETCPMVPNCGSCFTQE